MRNAYTYMYMCGGGGGRTKQVWCVGPANKHFNQIFGGGFKRI